MKTTTKSKGSVAKKGPTKKASMNPYENKMKSFIDDAEKKIRELKNRGTEVNEELKEKYDAQVHTLSLKKDEVQKKLQKITHATGDRFHEVQEDVTDKMEDIKEEFEEAYLGIKQGFKYLFRKISK